VVLATAGLTVAALQAAAFAKGWPAYLDGPAHWSDDAAATAITPGNATGLVQKWHDFAGQDYLSSPVVADGAVFIGSDSGWFYKLSEATGTVLAKKFLGTQPKETCGSQGLVDTATVAVSPVTHADTVYVGGPDGYLFALSAASLAVQWKSVINIPSAKVSNYFEWSSPTVSGGRIYIGVSSHCDVPLIRGGVMAFRRSTGKKLAEFYTVPKGSIGGSVWSSVAVGPGGDVYATTGNGPTSRPLLSDSESILRLAPGTLKLLGRFQVPKSDVKFDSDFGASPTIFGKDVGACDKNGLFYAVRRTTMKLAWKARIGAHSSATTYAQCSAAAIYNGKDLFFAGPAVTIKGTAYRGSVQERSPASGKVIWETGLPEGVIGSPSLDGGGVIAVGTFDNGPAPNATYLVNARTGAVVSTLVSGSRDFPQTVFAGKWIFSANGSGVYAWQRR
jgi:outer membrane protein assembly factor BamB